MPPINYGDTAWVLASSALVLLMTPGLALFYGGMVRTKSVLNMLMMNFVTISVVSILWVFYGFSLSFTTDKYHGLIGGSDFYGLRGAFDASTTTPDHGTPIFAFAAFQLMFAIITPALISGAIADRARFGPWIIFVTLWTTIVYFPVAHWVFFFDSGKGGWIADRLKPVRRWPPTTSPRSPSSTRRWRPVRRCWAGSSWSGSATVSPQRWVVRPVPSPAWSRSPRRVRRSNRWVRSHWASSPVPCVPLPSA